MRIVRLYSEYIATVQRFKENDRDRVRSAVTHKLQYARPGKTRRRSRP